MQKIIDQIEAAAFIEHLNPIREVIQPKIDANKSDNSEAIETVCRWYPIPVIEKEVGFCTNSKSIQNLVNCGVPTIDVAGRRGTRFDINEIPRHPDI